MYWRIYARVWLSCVILAGCVLAAEEAGAPSSPSASDEVRDKLTDAERDNVAYEPYASDRDLFIDDEAAGEGSGGGRVDPDVESSGSGWGPDDEDARAGSGAESEDGGEAPRLLPEDDEDYPPSAPPLLPDPDTPDVRVPVVTDSPVGAGVDVRRLPEPVDTEVGQKVNVGPGQGAGAGQAAGTGGAAAPPAEDDINVREDDKSQEEGQGSETRPSDNVVFIMNNKTEDRATSFFAQPGILFAVIGGAVVGLLCAILVVMFIVYRMRKKDEGSYALDEPKRSPAAASYGKGHNNREFYA